MPNICSFMSCYRVILAFAVLLVLLLSLSIATSPVVDECRPGWDVTHLREKAVTSNEHEVSLIFYYVAWCGDSYTARRVYEKLALHYNERLYFAAVDCWQLACNCSRTFASGSGTGAPDRWPTLIVHYGRYVTIEYNGSWKLAPLRRFLDALFVPLQRIHNMEDFAQLSLQSDAVVLALFTSADNDEYGRYVAAAIKWLEFDPERTLRFAVALGSAAEEAMEMWKIPSLPCIVRINSNGGMTVFTTPVHKWNASHLVRWVRYEHERNSNISYGYSSPERLVERMRKGSVLAILTNTAYSHTNSDFYAEMTAVMRKHLPNVIPQSELQCVVINESCAAPVEVNYTLTDRCFSKRNLKSKHIRDYYALNTQLQATFNSNTPNWSDNGKDLILFYAQRMALKCVPNTESPPFMRISIAKFLKQSIDKSNISRPNRTLSVLLMDAGDHVDFLKIHGLKLMPTDAAAVFIADASKETVHIMQTPFTYASLLQFVSDYYAEYLEPVLKSSRRPYDSKGHETGIRYVHLDETNSVTLLDRLQSTANATRVVLLYSPACPFSSVMLQALLQVAALLPGREKIQFIRLNTQANDLPWQLVMPTTPTLIVFPSGRPEESLRFPDNLKVDVRNIFGFILAQLEPIEQVGAALTSCRQVALPPLRLRKCLQFAKDLVSQHISQHLKQWQIYRDERHHILERLKQFKDISLDIQRSFTL